jgi:hypothetical protein
MSGEANLYTSSLAQGGTKKSSYVSKVACARLHPIFEQAVSHPLGHLELIF